MKNKRKIIKEHFALILQINKEDVDYNSTPGTINSWDSLNHLNLIASFEDEFLIDIEPEEIAEMMIDYQNFEKIILDKIEK